MSASSIKVETEERTEEKLKESTGQLKKLLALLSIIEENQSNRCSAIQAQSPKEERLETEDVAILNTCNNKIENLNKKAKGERSASEIPIAPVI